MTKVAIHQPNFLPWTGFWNKFAESDVFVVYAGAQFEKGGFQNRVRLDGGWLTVPVTGGLVPIKDIRIADTRALAKMARTIRQRTARQPFRERLEEVIVALESWSGTALLDLNLRLMDAMRHALGLEDGRLVVDLDVRGGPPGETLTELVRQHGDTYLSGAGGRTYMRRSDLGVGTVLLQRVGPRVGGDTALQLIAQADDPAEAIVSAAGWDPWT